MKAAKAANAANTASKACRPIAILAAAALIVLLAMGAIAHAAPSSGYGSGPGSPSAGAAGPSANVTDGLDAPDSGKVPTASTSMPSWYPSNVNSFQRFHNGSAPRVVDDAGLFTDDEEAQLRQKADDMRERLGMDFVVFTDTSTHGLSRAVYAADFYEFNGYGVGDDYNGLVIFTCMESGNRGWWTAATGACRSKITEGNINHVDDVIEPYMRSGEYFTAMYAYLDNMDTLYSMGFFPPRPQTFGIAGLLAVAVGLTIGLMNRARKKRAMVTVERAVEARRYVADGGLSLRRQDDSFLHSTFVRTKRVKVESKGGGSSFSGGYHSSGGGSFSGGGRSF